MRSDGVSEASRVPLQQLEVQQVLGTTAGPFVLDELGPPDHVDRLPSVLRLHAVQPTGFELDAVDRGDDVHAVRGNADLQDAVGLCQIVRGQLTDWRAERAERFVG